jgi:hypothetical protein
LLLLLMASVQFLSQGPTQRCPQQTQAESILVLASKVLVSQATKLGFWENLESELCIPEDTKWKE